MSKLISRAGLVVAHYENVRRVPPDQRQLGRALEGFLRAFVAELGCAEEGVYVHLAKQGEYGRALNFYGLVEDEEVLVTLQADKDHKGEPWTEEAIRSATLEGELGLLRKPDAWTNAFFVGVAKTRLVSWGSPALWSHCYREDAAALRLAWESIVDHGRPWEWEFGLKDKEDAYLGQAQVGNPRSRVSDTRQDWCREVRRRALRLFQQVWTPPMDFPLELLHDRAKGTTELEAIAYYLLEHPMGPGLSPEGASRVTSNGRRELKRARDSYLRKNKKASRWPEEKARPWQITELRPESTMAHH